MEDFNTCNKAAMWLRKNGFDFKTTMPKEYTSTPRPFGCYQNAKSKSVFFNVREDNRDLSASTAYNQLCKAG